MTDETHYAFPHKFQSGPDETTICFGMTLRDYFAAKAMQAAMSKNELDHHSMKDIAEGSYKFADAMLKAREQ